MANENDNLPVKKEESIVDEFKEMALLSFIDGILPKLEPFIGPAVVKLEEYFGDDSKIFLIRRMKNQPVKVIVLDNTKGDYCIDNFVVGENLSEEDKENNIQYVTDFYNKMRDEKIKMIKSQSKLKRLSTFDTSEDAVIAVHDTAQFITKLLSGEFTNPKNQK